MKLLVLACALAAIGVSLAIVPMNHIKSPFLSHLPVEARESDEVASPYELGATVINDLSPDQAAELTRVHLPGVPSDEVQYAGLVTVRPKNHMFFWFFENHAGHKNAPTILWLQGGPGSSSQLGNFWMHGPNNITDDLQLVKNPLTWATDYNLIYIDNPVGPGFSYTEDDSYPTDMDGVAEDLYTCLKTWAATYPQYSAHDFHIFGESYGGKYIPAIAHRIFKAQEGGEDVIHLKTLGIGDGLTDPYVQALAYAQFGYELGLVADGPEMADILKRQDDTRKMIEQEKWLEASRAYGDIPGAIDAYAGGPNIYDLRTYDNYDMSRISKYMNQPAVKKALHVGDIPFLLSDGKCYAALEADIAKSMKSVFPDLLSKYRVLLYNGQYDIIIPTSTGWEWIKTIDWEGRDAMMSSKMVPWKVDNVVGGFARSHGNLTWLIVRDAGHMVPYNVGRRALAMLHNMIENKPFTS